MTEAGRALRFFLLSCSAGLIQMGSFALMNETLAWRPWLSYLIALTLSVLWNFTLNRKFTFRSTANIPRAMTLVILYYAVFTPVSTWAEHIMTDNWHWNEYLVTFINMTFNLITEFIFQRYVVYGKRVDTAVKPKPEPVIQAIQEEETI